MTFEWGSAEFDPSTIALAADEEDAAIEEEYVFYITVTGHSDEYYDGTYLRGDDWAGFAHFAKTDGSAHIYYLDSGAGYWQFDYREQDGT